MTLQSILSGSVLDPIVDVLDGVTPGSTTSLTDLLNGGLGGILDNIDLDGVDLSLLNLDIPGLGGSDNFIPELNLSTGEVTIVDLITELGGSNGLLVVNGKLLFKNANDAIIDLNVAVGQDGSLLNTGIDVSLGDLITVIIGGGGGGPGDGGDDPSAEKIALETAYRNITRVDINAPEAPTDDVVRIDSMADQIERGTLTFDEAVAKIVDFADDSTAVATTAYQFFVGRTPTEAGLDYLVNVTDSTNPTDLNDPYYQNFNTENRFINFGVNLGKLGEGRSNFVGEYGGLNLSQAVGKAYAEIFGTAADPSKIDAILNTQVQNVSRPGETYTRAEYFKYYGIDDIGTKAAMVGWLMGEGVKADVGAYAIANEHFLTDLADGDAQFNVDLIGTYSSPESGRVDFT